MSPADERQSEPTELLAFATDIVAKALRLRDTAAWLECGREQLAAVSSRQARRELALFRTTVAARNDLAAAFVELFVFSRQRRHALAYLTVQEGDAFEGESSYDSNVPSLLDALLRRVGRTPAFALTLGVGRLRTSIHLDPLIDLRAIYSEMMSRPRAGGVWSRLRLALKRAQFAGRCRLLTVLIDCAFRWADKKGPEEGLRALLHLRSTRQAIATLIVILFPQSRELDEFEWSAFFDRLEKYLAPAVSNLLQILPGRSFREHGLAKLGKVAFGTLVGRAAAGDGRADDPAGSIFDSFRVAYSWGCTYPLVDDVLDRSTTSVASRRALVSTLEGLFSDHSCPPASEAPEVLLANEDPVIVEVTSRLREVLSLLEQPVRPGVRSNLRGLLDAHRRDSSRRLESLDSGCMQDLMARLLVDSMLKASLVRLATMEICGIDTSKLAGRMLARGLFNQLGDDLWDIAEDLEAQRVTPFTLFLASGAEPDPFSLYIAYTAWLTRDLSQRRRQAAFMGVLESIRDALASFEQELTVPPAVRQGLERALGCDGRTLDRLVEASGPIDPDVVLFRFENALLGRRWQ